MNWNNYTRRSYKIIKPRKDTIQSLSITVYFDLQLMNSGEQSRANEGEYTNPDQIQHDKRAQNKTLSNCVKGAGFGRHNIFQ